MKVFLIQDLISLGYWSNSHSSFKGYLFATQYSSVEEAEVIAEKLDGPVTIVTVYI